MIKLYSSNIQFEKNRHFASVYLPVIIDGQIYLEYVPNLTIGHRSDKIQTEIREICLRRGVKYITSETLKDKKRQLVYKMDKNVVVGVNDFTDLNESSKQAVRFIKKIIEDNTEPEIDEKELKEVKNILAKYN